MIPLPSVVKPVTKLVYFEIIINSFFEAVATETSLSFSFYSKLKAEKEDLVNTRNQLSADLERLLNQREVIYESVSLTKRKHLQLNQYMYFLNLLFYFYSKGMKVLLSLRQVMGIFLPNEVTMMVKVGPLKPPMV